MSTMNWHQRLVDINACTPALEWCRQSHPGTDRAAFDVAWDDCEDVRWMLWLGAKVLPRRRLVAVTLEIVGTVAHLMSDEAVTEVLGPLAQWTQGADIDVGAVRERAREIKRAAAAYAAAYAAADAAAYAAAYAAAAYAAADAAAAAYAAAYAAADAGSVMCDVLRAHLGPAEVYTALMGAM